ncbi:MAG: membrane protein insertion efficiency factor YidD [Clostridia bacterium]|nr:membrane protein insertion efficiency factor YidD [Clostridia bacterium]
MKHVCVFLIRLYQKYLSPLKRNPCCRFTPTCSAYAVQAFMNRGFFVGFGLTVWRILRCNPFSAGGYDPVPPKKIPKYARDRRKKTDTPLREENNDENEKREEVPPAAQDTERIDP